MGYNGTHSPPNQQRAARKNGSPVGMCTRCTTRFLHVPRSTRMLGRRLATKISARGAQQEVCRERVVGWAKPGCNFFFARSGTRKLVVVCNVWYSLAPSSNQNFFFFSSRGARKFAGRRGGWGSSPQRVVSHILPFVDFFFWGGGEWVGACCSSLRWKRKHQAKSTFFSPSPSKTLPAELIKRWKKNWSGGKEVLESLHTQRQKKGRRGFFFFLEGGRKQILKCKADPRRRRLGKIPFFPSLSLHPSFPHL